MFQSQMGDMGSGAGKGGGSGGSIRDAGGAYGKLEAAREEEYFHKLVCFVKVRVGYDRLLIGALGFWLVQI